MVGVNAALITVGVAGSGVAYALGIQWHTSNGIQHGCPADTGCYGSGDDFNRHGWNEDLSGMTNSKVGIYFDPGGDGGSWPDDYVGGQSDSSTIRTDAEFDTNPYDECLWATFHSVETNSLNGHFHWTEDMPQPCA